LFFVAMKGTGRQVRALSVSDRNLSRLAVFAVPFFAPIDHLEISEITVNQSKSVI